MNMCVSYSYEYIYIFLMILHVCQILLSSKLLLHLSYMFKSSVQCVSYSYEIFAYQYMTNSRHFRLGGVEPGVNILFPLEFLPAAFKINPLQLHTHEIGMLLLCGADF